MRCLRRGEKTTALSCGIEPRVASTMEAGRVAGGPSETFFVQAMAVAASGRPKPGIRPAETGKHSATVFRSPESGHENYRPGGSRSLGAMISPESSIPVDEDLSSSCSRLEDCTASVLLLRRTSPT